MIRLDLNENPFDLPPDLKEQVLAALRRVEFNRYHSQVRPELLTTLARRSGVTPDMVVLGNGGDEVIALAIAAVAAPGGRVILPVPTFSGYPALAAAAGVEVREVASPGFCFDAAGLAAALAAGPAPTTAGRGGTLLFLCRPNNPTGYVCPEELVHELLAVRSDAVVAVDEAYFEFSGLTVAGLLGRYPNLLIIRTLSKAFCLAGIRVGYALAAPGLAARLERVRPAFNLSVAAHAIALEVLRHAPRFEALVRELIGWREELHTGLAALPGVRVYPAPTNFLLLHVGPEAPAVHQRLWVRGVRVRHYGGILDEYLRVSVGTPAENQAVLRALRGELSKGGRTSGTSGQGPA